MSIKIGSRKRRRSKKRLQQINPYRPNRKNPRKKLAEKNLCQKIRTSMKRVKTRTSSDRSQTCCKNLIKKENLLRIKRKKVAPKTYKGLIPPWRKKGRLNKWIRKSRRTYKSCRRVETYPMRKTSGLMFNLGVRKKWWMMNQGLFRQTMMELVEGVVTRENVGEVSIQCLPPKIKSIGDLRKTGNLPKNPDWGKSFTCKT